MLFNICIYMYPFILVRTILIETVFTHKGI